MKVTMTYEGKSVEVEVKDEEFKKLFKKQEKKTGWEKAEEEEVFYFIDSCMQVCDDWQYNSVLSSERGYEAGNYFNSEKLADNMARAISLWLKIQRRASEICEPIDEEEIIKWIIAFCNNTIHPVYFAASEIFNTVYFDTKEHAQQIIDEFEDELTWYFTEFKNRMDA